MVRYSLFLLFVSISLFAQDKNSTQIAYKPIIIQDNSGASQEEIRQKATTHDTKDNNRSLSVKDVVDAIDENGSVTLTKIVQKSWEELSPTPKGGFDWIQTKYGDWLRGHIKGLYQDTLEFDSKEFGLYSFDFKDITQIKSNALMQVNIDHVAIFTGIIRLKGNTITIISGDGSYSFDRKLIVSIATARKRELSRWSGDITLSIDVRRGSIEQADYTLRALLQRRTAKNRFLYDYLGRYSQVSGTKTSEDNRFNFKYDRFLSKNFFITPIFGEVYQNYFQNLKAQITLGAGVGYTIYDTPIISWDLSAGPAYLYTKHYTSNEDGESQFDSLSFEFSSKYSYKITSLSKVKVDYKATLASKDSGGYRHHGIVKLENDIVKDKIYIDISAVWDYIQYVSQNSLDKAPPNSDYQLLVGAGVKF